MSMTLWLLSHDSLDMVLSMTLRVLTVYDSSLHQLLVSAATTKCWTSQDFFEKRRNEISRDGVSVVVVPWQWQGRPLHSWCLAMPRHVWINGIDCKTAIGSTRIVKDFLMAQPHYEISWTCNRSTQGISRNEKKASLRKGQKRFGCCDRSDWVSFTDKKVLFQNLRLVDRCELKK